MSKEFIDGDQVKKELIEYWIDLIDEDLGCFTDKASVLQLIYQLRDADMLNVVSIKNTGIFAFSYVPDFRGGKCLAELVFYIRKENRGDVRLVKKYLQRVEEMADRKHCNSVRIGGNIGYKDDSFLRLLNRWGYKADTVVKYLTKTV